jgi:protein gp37
MPYTLRMSIQTSIEWTDATWNPVRGCSKVSAGCLNCYAQTFAERWRGVKGHPYEQGFDLKLVPEKLEEPFKWKKSKKVFVNSMSDLFHEQVPDDYIDKVIQVMIEADLHIYQVLTKRPARMKNLLSQKKYANLKKCFHIWWGVSVENKAQGIPRIKDLQETPVAVRFLSIEPLLEDLGKIDLSLVDWAIVGGESGPGSREMKKHWVTSIQNQCEDAEVAFFFKQWGGVQKSKNGRDIDGKTYSEFPNLKLKSA